MDDLSTPLFSLTDLNELATEFNKHLNDAEEARDDANNAGLDFSFQYYSGQFHAFMIASKAVSNMMESPRPVVYDIPAEPDCEYLIDCDSAFWKKDSEGWRLWLSYNLDWGSPKRWDHIFAHFAPLRVPTEEELEEAGLVHPKTVEISKNDLKILADVIDIVSAKEIDDSLIAKALSNARKALDS